MYACTRMCRRVRIQKVWRVRGASEQPVGTPLDQLAAAVGAVHGRAAGQVRVSALEAHVRSVCLYNRVCVCVFACI